jgi:hypothetical protein
MWEDVVAALESVRPAAERPARGRGRRPERAAGVVDTTAYLAASLGAPRWLERLQEIEGHRLEAEGRLERRWLELVEALRDDPAAFERRWRQVAARWSFAEHNRLVAEHNEYYPVERKLRFDLRAGDYVGMWGMEWRMRPLDAAWVLERFPPRLPERAAPAPHRGHGDAGGPAP